MPLSDDLKDSRKMLKGKTAKDKWEYFWEYYKFHVLGVVIGIIVIISIIKTAIDSRQTGFQVLMINTLANPDETVCAKYLGIDTDKYAAILDSSYIINPDINTYDEATYVNIQKIIAIITAGDADAMITDREIIDYYSGSEFYADLRDYFSEDFLTELGDKVLWLPVYDSKENCFTDETYPAAINISEAPQIVSNGCFYGTEGYMVIIVNTKRGDLIPKFYDFLYSE